VVGMALVGWRDIAELVAERVEHVRSQSFAVAARALGTDAIRFFRLHVIPFLRPAIGVEFPFHATESGIKWSSEHANHRRQPSVAQP